MPTKAKKSVGWMEAKKAPTFMLNAASKMMGGMSQFMKNSMSNLIISITSSLAQTETMRHVNRPTSTPTALSGNQCTCIRSRWKAIIKVAASDNRPASTPYDSDSSSTDSAWAGRCMACLVFTGCDAETKIACSPELTSLGDVTVTVVTGLRQLTTTPTQTSTTSTNTQLAIIAFAWHNSTRITHQRTTHSRRTLRAPQDRSPSQQLASLLRSAVAPGC